jgi:hypothetical protein
MRPPAAKDKDKRASDVVAAAERVTQRSVTQITEVIEPESVDGKGVPLNERCAATAAAFIVCGACYFVIWISIVFRLGTGDDGMNAGFFESWHVPTLATAITAMSAFLRPKWTYRIFGKLMKPFDYLLSSIND